MPQQQTPLPMIPFETGRPARREMTPEEGAAFTTPTGPWMPGASVPATQWMASPSGGAPPPLEEEYDRPELYRSPSPARALDPQQIMLLQGLQDDLFRRQPMGPR